MKVVKGLENTLARDIQTPKNYWQAIQSDAADAWNDSMAAELRNLKDFGTFEVVPKPKGRKIVDCMASWTPVNMLSGTDPSLC